MANDSLEPTSGGHALAEFLFPAPAPRRAGAILKWWEKRRLPYNLAVGATGLFTLGYTWVLGSLFFPSGATDAGAFLILPLVYGALANLCYSLGPIAEIAIEKVFRGRVLPTGPGLFRIGLTFSIGLTLFPALLMTIVWVVMVVANTFGLG